MRVLPTGPGARNPEIVWPSFGRSDSAKRGLCEFHPPISKGGMLAAGSKGSHSGDLRVHGRLICRFHQHLQHPGLLLGRQSVQNTLNVFRAEA